MTQTVRDVMHVGVETVRPHDSVKHAASLMQAADVGPLPVCDGERLVGIITDRDIVVRAVAAGRDPTTTPVCEAMTPDVVCVRPEQDLDAAVRLMGMHAVRRLPVLEHGRVVGMLALADLARHGEDLDAKAAALEGVSRVRETETDVP
jgi:CBS domain-containing protein